MMIVGDAAHLPLPDRSVDLVLTSPPSDWSPALRSDALSEIARVARGRVIVLANTPGQQSVGARYPAFNEKYVHTLIGLNSQIGDRVLDCFAGTGVAVRVAKKMGRVGIGVELDSQLVGAG